MFYLIVYILCIIILISSIDKLEKDIPSLEARADEDDRDAQMKLFCNSFSLSVAKYVLFFCFISFPFLFFVFVCL